MNPQQQLPIADIHVPGAVSVWPPAYGWWILAVLVIILTVIAFKAVKKWRKARVQRNLAMDALMAVDLEHYTAWQQINEILKRAAMVYYSRETVAALTGKKWKDFLLDAMGKKSMAFDDAWLTFAYSATVSQQQVKTYHQFAQQWLKVALPATPANQGVAK